MNILGNSVSLYVYNQVFEGKIRGESVLSEAMGKFGPYGVSGEILLGITLRLLVERVDLLEQQNRQLYAILEGMGVTGPAKV